MPEPRETPRRRSATSRQAVLDATYALVRESGLGALTVEGIARRAGVGKQTIYRWWPNKTEVAVEAFVDQAMVEVDFPDTGDITADLRDVLRQSAAVLSGTNFGPFAAAFLGEAARDPQAAESVHAALFGPVRSRYRDRVAQARRAGQIADSCSDDDFLDLAFGPLWFRLLTNPAGVTPHFGTVIADLLTRGPAASAGPTSHHGCAQQREGPEADRESSR